MKTDTSNVAATPFEGPNLVYVKPLARDEAEALLEPHQIEQINALDQLFAVHASSGQRLAIVEGRDAAFAAARAHDLRPRSVH